MLGIGIFLSPSVVAGHLASPALFLGVWALAGLFAYAGAVACAELGAMMPRAGGDYVFQRAAFGPSVAFASGWVLFAAIMSGSIAAMSVGLCQYQLPTLLGVDLSQEVLGPVTGVQLCAIALILAFTAINAAGTRLSATAQNLTTLIPIGVLALMALYAIVAGPSPGQVVAAPPAAARPISAEALVMAYMAVYFAYSGWNSVIYVAGEVRDPGRNIPRALTGGTLAVTALYLLLCLAFLSVLGLDGLAALQTDAGSATATALAGDVGRIGITVLIACALVASLNGTILGGARVAYAMGQDGAFWAGAARLDAKTGVPSRALWLQALWACGLVLSNQFEQILNLVSLAMVITGSLTVASLFVLRRRMPAAQRPYRATGYPWLPALYLLSSALVLLVMAGRALAPDEGTTGAWYPLVGLGILALAFATHRIWLRGRQRGALAALVAALVGAGLLLAAPAARADAPERAPSGTMDVAPLQAAAAAARDTQASRAVRDLYAVLTCADQQPYEVTNYARYCDRYRKYQATYRERFKHVAGPWIADKRPDGLPEVVLYPFSGADLISSVLAYPDATLHIHMSLEHGGPAYALEALTPQKRGRALWRLLDSAKGLLNLGDSKTKDLRLAHLDDLPGKLPITLVGLAAHDAEVVSIRYFKVGDDGRLEYFDEDEKVGERPKTGHRAQFDARYSNFELAFKLPGSDRLRLLQHVATDLHDSKLGAESGKGVRAWLHSLGRVSFMTKAATYLLWSDGFSTIRNIAIAQSEWMISDASGVPRRFLPASEWEVTPYGKYSCPLLDWAKKDARAMAISDELADWFRTSSAEPGLPFRFGYIDCKGQNSVVIAKRRR